jgi:DNA-binding NarL/FixJ family response regulator
MAKVRVLVAENTDIALTGILSILSGYRTIEVTDTASTSAETLKLYKSGTPDICLVSNSLPDLDIHHFMMKISDIDEKASVILMADKIGINHLNAALKAGINGCILKNIEKKKLRDFILEAATGEKVFSNEISTLMRDRYADLAQNKPVAKPFSQITKRESEVLQLIVDGYTSQEIAKLLYISPRTVETHRSNLMQKLKIKNTAALVRFALEEGPFSKT